jgi:mannose-6-phosphate isomerase-like protein (cupin superfamily)
MSTGSETATTAYAVKRIEDMRAIHHGAVTLAAAELGVRSFGMQLLDFPAGFTGYPEHDHAGDGMEEVYVVLRGSGAFTVDGERVPVDEGRMLRIAPEARRTLQPGPDGVRLLAVGCTIGRPYERPEGFR